MSAAKWRPFCLGLNVLKRTTNLHHNFFICLLTNVYQCKKYYVSTYINQYYSFMGSVAGFSSWKNAF